MLWHTSTGARPVSCVTRCTAASSVGTQSSMVPSTGSRFTASHTWPARRRARSQGRHAPRLHRKPCTSTTPRGPPRPMRTVPGCTSRSGSALLRNGWCQQNNRTEATTSPAQARSLCAPLASGTARGLLLLTPWLLALAALALARCISTNCSPSTPACSSSGSATPASAQPSERGAIQCHHSAIASSVASTRVFCRRATMAQPPARRAPPEKKTAAEPEEGHKSIAALCRPACPWAGR